MVPEGLTFSSYVVNGEIPPELWFMPASWLVSRELFLIGAHKVIIILLSVHLQSYTIPPKDSENYLRKRPLFSTIMPHLTFESPYVLQGVIIPLVITIMGTFEGIESYTLMEDVSSSPAYVQQLNLEDGIYRSSVLPPWSGCNGNMTTSFLSSSFQSLVSRWWVGAYRTFDNICWPSHPVCYRLSGKYEEPMFHHRTQGEGNQGPAKRPYCRIVRGTLWDAFLYFDANPCLLFNLVIGGHIVLLRVRLSYIIST